MIWCWSPDRGQNRHQDLLREVEKERRLSQLPRHRQSIIKLAAEKLGVLLLKLGTRLKQFEQSPTVLKEGLLSLALEFETVEEYIIVGLGLSWHWDYEGLGMSRFHYREMIARLFAAHGFAEYLTSEPNIRIDRGHFLPDKGSTAACGKIEKSLKA